MRRLVAWVILAALLVLGQGCMTTYYQYQKGGPFSVATGRDTTDFGGDKEAGKGKFIQPWVLAYVLAHESSNLPFYYERLSSWEGSPPMHFAIQTPVLMAEYSDRRDQVAAWLKTGALDRLLPGLDPKKKHVVVGRACAAVVGLDTWLACGFALNRDGYARYGWGHKPELGGDKMNLAGFGLHVSINPDAQTVSVRTSKRDLGGGFAVLPKVATFDVSKVKHEVTTASGKKLKVTAFDWTDGEGNSLATEAEFDELCDAPAFMTVKFFEDLAKRSVLIPPEVVAKSIKYMGTPESIQE